MASIILARKLLSVKLTKEEFDKVLSLKVNNEENKFKMIPYLNKVTNGQVRNKTCRLCLKPGRHNIFDKYEFDYVGTIKHILQIEVNENDRKPQHICTACKTTLKEAEQLKHTAEVTQWRLQQELEMVTCTLMDYERNDNSHHGGFFTEQGTREWICRKCRQSFNNQDAFAEHDKLLKCRSSTQCFVCESCGAELKSLTRLKRHRLIHTAELQYSCRECPYRGRTRYAVTVHERTHSGHRPLACPYCPATFLNSSNLASHRRRHLPPGYHCQVCARGFKFKEALQNHLATQHSTAKPHICKMCGKAFSTRKMLCRHERRVHNRPKMRSGILPTYLRQPDEHT